MKRILTTDITKFVKIVVINTSFNDFNLLLVAILVGFFVFILKHSEDQRDESNEAEREVKGVIKGDISYKVRKSKKE